MPRSILFSLLVSSILVCTSCQHKVVSPTSISIDYPVAYIINGGENSVSLLNINTLKIENTYFIPEFQDRYAHHIYLSSNKDKLAIAMPAYDFSGGHSGLHNVSALGGIAVLDAKTLELIQKIPVSFANHNAVFAENDQEIWTTTHSHSGELVVFSAQDGSEMHRQPLGPDPSEIIITPNQYALAAVGESSFVGAVSTKTKAEAKFIKVDLFPTNVWPGNDTLAIVENKNKKSINFIDIRTLKGIDAIDTPFIPGFSCFIHNELWIVEPNTKNVHIYQKRKELWQEVALLEAGEDAHSIGFVPEKNLVIIVNQKEASISLFEANTRRKIKTLPVGLKPNGIAIRMN